MRTSSAMLAASSPRTFDDLETAVRASVERLRAHPWIEQVPIHGLVFDVATGRLSELD